MRAKCLLHDIALNKNKNKYKICISTIIRMKKIGSYDFEYVFMLF